MRTFLLSCLLLGACSSAPDSGLPDATGGDTSTGGATGSATGGTVSTGGASATGGSMSTGWTLATGGETADAATATATGGTDAGIDAAPDSATGGTVATGGAQSTGGAIATGGSVSTGGATNTGGAGTGGAPCECSTGSCCDGCYFKSYGAFCGSFVSKSYCSPNLDSVACPGYADTIVREWRNQFCSGVSESCDGHTAAWKEVWSSCAPACITDSSTAAHCGACP